MESSGNHGANLRIGAQQPAQPDAEHLGVLEIAHGQLHLHVFGGVQSVGIFEMAVADRAGAAQQATTSSWVGTRCIAVLIVSRRSCKFG